MLPFGDVLYHEVFHPHTFSETCISEHSKLTHQDFQKKKTLLQSVPTMYKVLKCILDLFEGNLNVACACAFVKNSSERHRLATNRSDSLDSLFPATLGDIDGRTSFNRNNILSRISLVLEPTLMG
jgi:hypothetical protein